MLTPEIEQLLMAAAVERAQSAPSNELATGAGAAVGGLAGVSMPGKAKTKMAGSLIGLIAGGGLGQGVRNMVINNSPEAEILARYQAGIPAPGDDIRLQQLLADQYKRMGLS